MLQVVTNLVYEHVHDLLVMAKCWNIWFFYKVDYS